MDMDSGVGIDCGSRGWAGRGKVKEEQLNRIKIKNKKKSKVSVIGLKSIYWQGGLRENLFPCLFHLLEAAGISWLVASHHSDFHFCCHISSDCDPPTSLL